MKTSYKGMTIRTEGRQRHIVELPNGCDYDSPFRSLDDAKRFIDGYRESEGRRSEIYSLLRSLQRSATGAPHDISKLH